MNLVYMKHNLQSMTEFSRQKIFLLRLRFFSLVMNGKCFWEVITGIKANTKHAIMVASRNIHLAVIAGFS